MDCFEKYFNFYHFTNDKYCNNVSILFYFTSSFMSLCVDTTSFEDVSPQGISDDSSTGSRVHGKM